MKKLSKRAREANQSRIVLTQVLFRVNAAVWLVAGGVLVYGMVEDGNGWSSALVAFFFLIVIGCHLAGASIVSKNGGWAYVVAIAILLITLIPAFAGFPEALFVVAAVMNALTFINLIPLKAHYFDYA
jgi:hypothetical protein